MRATLRLLPLLLRRSPRQSAGAIALCAAGVAVATIVTATVLAADGGLDRRESRTVWRDPSPTTTSDATALQRRSVDWFDGKRIDRVDLAAADAGSTRDLPAPPGRSTFPEPGEVLVSPALAELIRTTPHDQLGDRFGEVTGVLPHESLANPDELVALVGTTADALGPATVTSVQPGRDLTNEVVSIDSFSTTQPDQLLQLYMDLALVAVVLVAVPAILLVGSAARLTASRREQRMAALRLAGATSGSVRLLTAAETTIGATIGALVGIALSYAIGPGLTDVPMAGGRWFRSDLVLPALDAFALFVGIVAACALTAVVSLRKVAAQPLGIARRVEAHTSRWPRVLGLLGAMGLLVLVTMVSASSSIQRSDGQPADLTVPMVAALGVVIASLALVGPWVTSLVGRAMTVASRRAPMLIAGRRVLDDPRAAYRTVGAVVLAGLIAGFLAGILPTVQSMDRDLTGGIAHLELRRVDADALIDDQRAHPERYGGIELEDDRTRDQHGSPPGTVDPESYVTISAPARGAALERLRTATLWIRGTAPILSSGDDVYGDVGFTQDVRRGSLAVLVAGLILAGGATAIAAAASVVDQRSIIARLTLCGTEVGTLQRARQLQSMLPLVVATAGSVGLGLCCSILLMLGFGAARSRIVSPEVPMLGLVVLGAAAMGWLAAAMTRPLLSAAVRHAATTADT